MESFVSQFRGFSQQILEMFFPLMKSFFFFFFFLLAAFSLALQVLLLPPTSINVWHTNPGCLSYSEFLTWLIWPWVYSSWLFFIYFFFWYLLVRFELSTHRHLLGFFFKVRVNFSSLFRFSIITIDSHGTLHFALGLVM